MKLRLAWLADWEGSDSYSAKETRVILRALARNPNLVPLWFALGSPDPPHYWHGIRVFPIPNEFLKTEAYLETLIHQQRPHLFLSNVTCADYPAGWVCLNRRKSQWVHRLNPVDADTSLPPAASRLLVGDEPLSQSRPNSIYVPYLRGFDPRLIDGADATTVLRAFQKVLFNGNITSPVRCSDPSSVAVLRPSSVEELLRRMERVDETPLQEPNTPILQPPITPLPHHSTTPSPHSAPVCLVMRQQLFCNSSWAQVMFELTNALIEIGVPTIPQDEQVFFAKEYIHREEDLFREGVPEKYQRVRQGLSQDYDPEKAITIYFSLLKAGLRYGRNGVFPGLGNREALYTTGNHVVTSDAIRQLTDQFEKIITPTWHVMRPYFGAGLNRRQGAVVPHGIDPAMYDPGSPPLAYATAKSFKFLQNSFPWITEKGFDLTIKAFSQAFTNQDDVCLVLRIPQIKNPSERNATFGRIERLVAEARAKPGSPEILLLEKDIAPHQRGGIYTGANCYVHPLRAEGFGITILEAMACGLPVIATPWSGPADFLSPRYTYTLRHSNPVAEKTRNGTITRYHVEPDIDHLVYLLRYVYEHYPEAKALGQQASLVAHTHWTWKQAAIKLAAAFSIPHLAA